MKPSNLKSFVLGAGIAIAALGLYALAATLNTFASGDVVSSEKINQNFANLNADITNLNTSKQARVTGTCVAGSSIREIAADGTVTCQTSTGSGVADGAVSTAKLADDAVTAAKTKDEPGGAQAVLQNSIDITGSTSFLLNKELVAPASGFVLVIGSVETCVEHVTGTLTNYFVGVSDGTTLSSDQDKGVLIGATAPTATYCTTITAQKMFPVFAGSTIFRLIGQRLSGPNVSTSDLTLSMMYMPTTYGGVFVQ